MKLCDLIKKLQEIAEEWDERIDVALKVSDKYTDVNEEFNIEIKALNQTMEDSDVFLEISAKDAEESFDEFMRNHKDEIELDEFES